MFGRQQPYRGKIPDGLRAVLDQNIADILSKFRGDCDDAGALVNADWIMDFQRWVQDQSITGKAPTFGSDPSSERIQAQNGVLYAADEEGTATYMVQLSVNFTKYYEVI